MWWKVRIVDFRICGHSHRSPEEVSNMEGADVTTSDLAAVRCVEILKVLVGSISFGLFQCVLMKPGPGWSFEGRRARMFSTLTPMWQVEAALVEFSFGLEDPSTLTTPGSRLSGWGSAGPGDGDGDGDGDGSCDCALHAQSSRGHMLPPCTPLGHWHSSHWRGSTHPSAVTVPAKYDRARVLWCL